jgi:hypothetical protein
MNKAASLTEIIMRALESGSSVTMRFQTGMQAYLDECLVEVVVK